MATSTVTPHAPAPDITPPTSEQPANGTPLTRVPLPADLLERIRAKATTQAPASEVTQASAKPIASTPATPAETAKVAAPPVPPPAAVKPAEPPKAEAKVEAPAKKEGITQVREALERAEAKLRDHDATIKERTDALAKVAEYEGKVKAWEERYSKELEPQIRQLTEKEKRLQEAEERLRVKDYTATDHFHSTYDKPIAETHQEALQFIGELVASTDAGKVQATQEHLNWVIGAPNANEAAARAEQLFGSTFTPQLVNYRQRLRALGTKRAEAMSRASVESETFFKAQQEQQLSDAARFRTAVEGKMAAYLPKPVDADPEEQAAYQEGQKLSRLIAEGVQDLDQRGDLSARILAMPVQERLTSLRLARVTKELAEAKELLGRYQRTEPDVSTSGKGAPDAPEGDGTPLVGQNPTLHNRLMQVARGVATGKFKP